jgi:hypothetical protein
VQVDPIKPTSKAPLSERLKLEHEKLLSSFAFNFNLRRYTVAVGNAAAADKAPMTAANVEEATINVKKVADALAAGPGGSRSPRHRHRTTVS